MKALVTPLGVLLGLNNPVARSERVNVVALVSLWERKLMIHGLTCLLAEVVSLQTVGPTLEWVPTETWLLSEAKVAVFVI